MSYLDYLKFRQPWLFEAETYPSALVPAGQIPMDEFEASFALYSPVAEAEQILSEANAALGYLALIGSIDRFEVMNYGYEPGAYAPSSAESFTAVE